MLWGHSPKYIGQEHLKSHALSNRLYLLFMCCDYYFGLSCGKYGTLPVQFENNEVRFSYCCHPISAARLFYYQYVYCGQAASFILHGRICILVQNPAPNRVAEFVIWARSSATILEIYPIVIIDHIWTSVGFLCVTQSASCTQVDRIFKCTFCLHV